MVSLGEHVEQLTGRCCFCQLKLSDPKSAEVVYGPTRAKHYDLPRRTKGK